MELPNNPQIHSDEEIETVSNKPNLFLVYISLGIASIVFGVIVGLQQWAPDNDIATSKVIPFIAPLINSYDSKDSLTVNATINKPIIINFWASWCGPCRVEMKNVETIWKKYEGKVLIIGIATQDTQEAVENFVSDMSITYPISLDSSSSIAREYQISQIPTTIFVDSKGNIHKRSIGTISEEFIEKTLIEIME
jgi:thiol-disulfide isomerase/thioredoxin